MTRDQARKIYDLCCASRATTRDYIVSCTMLRPAEETRALSEKDTEALVALLGHLETLVTQ